MGSTLSKKQKYGVILTCLGTSLLMGGLYYYNGKFNKNPEIQSEKSDTNYYIQIPNQLSDSNYYIKIPNQPSDSIQSNESQLQKAAEQIKVEFQGNLLTMNTIMQIFQKSFDLAKPQYGQITLEHRIQRRNARAVSNNSLYQQLVLEYIEQIEKLKEEKEIELCQSLKISEEVFQESVTSLMQSQQIKQFFMFQASQRQQIKESIPSNKTLSIDELKQIISYQVEILTKKPKEMMQMMKALSVNQDTKELIPFVINTILGDYCYEKFEIEDEDMLAMLQNQNQNQNISADQTIQKLFQQLEMVAFKLMKPFC